MIIFLVAVAVVFLYCTISCYDNNVDYEHNIKYATSKYKCPFYLKWPLVNTIYTLKYYDFYNYKYVTEFKKRARYEYINYNNADFLLEWLIPPRPEDKNNPIIVFSPTIDASSSYHVYRYYLMLRLYKKRRYNIVYIDFRGYSCELYTQTTFYETALPDTHNLLTRIIEKYPKSNMYLVGISLGGCVFTNLFKNYKMHNNIKGMVLVSCPTNVVNIQQLNCKHYCGYSEKIITDHIRAYFNKNAISYLHHRLNDRNKKVLLNMKSFNDFFINYIQPINNNKYKDILEWSNEHDTIPILKDIQIPTLIIHSSDDFISNYSNGVLDILVKNTNISYIITKYGGHLGFIQKDKKLYYRNYILNHIISIENSVNSK